MKIGRQNKKSALNLRPTLLGIHFFRSSGQRIASRRTGELAELIVMFGGVYLANETSSGIPVDFKAQTGDVVYWPANSDRIEVNDPDDPTECIAIYLRWPSSPAGLPRKVHDSGNLIRLLSLRLLALKNDPVPVPEPIIRSYLSTLVAEYTRLSMTAGNPLVARIAAYIERHLGEPFTLTDLAAAIGLNRFYLGRAFKKITKLTPMEFVRRKRVEHALGMLAGNPKFTMQSIAPRVGIADAVQLRRLLKRCTGLGARSLARLARNKQSDPFNWSIDTQQTSP